MTTATQYWSIADGSMFIIGKPGDKNYIRGWSELDEQQSARVADAFDLWGDVSGFNPIEVEDNVDVARGATTQVNDGLFGLGDWVWQTTLSRDYSRIALADIADESIRGVNKTQSIKGGAPGDNLYHEIYIDTATEGSTTFGLGSTAFASLLHEIGHSVLGSPLNPNLGVDVTEGHIDADLSMSVMAESITNPDLDGVPLEEFTWQPSTPMTLDIDYASSIYGRATQTRLGNDTYGFNAFFSDGNDRPALDFSRNTRPFVTIFDNGGNDTLDASGFGSYTFSAYTPRAVQIDLEPGAESVMLDGGHQTFAVIYKSTTSDAETWIENAIGGEAADKLYGNIKSNELIGNGGSDILDGRDGADVMIGGSGDDIYHVDNYGDDVRELLIINTSTWETRQDGVDKVIATVDHELHDNVENLDLTGAAVLGICNRLDNVIHGNDNNNELYGLAGNDTLDGLAGADNMYGGIGSDVYYVDNAGDRVIEYTQEYDSDTGQWVDGGTNDRIVSSIDIVTPLAENVEHLGLAGTAITGTGNELDNFIGGNDQNNYLYGNAGADVLIGGIGADYMSGGSGDDTYYVDNPGDRTYEYNRFFGTRPHLSGTDLVYSDTADYTLGSQVENMTLLINGVNGTGNGLANVITGNQWSNTLRGLGGADTLAGGVGSDTLEGGAGNDILKGGVNDDTMRGGEDDDTYYVDSVRDRVIEGSGARSGIDLVYSDAPRHTLAANVENLTLLDDALNGTGNGLANIIIGNEQINTLKGMDGLDTLEGNGGADILEGGAGDDLLRGGEGADTMRGGADSDRADYSLAWDSVVVDLMRGGIGGEAAGDTYDSIEGVIGSEYADVIRGTDGADIIMGLGDGDLIEGRGGNDTLTGGDADYSNTFVFNRGWGEDTVTDFHVGMDHLDMSGIAGLTSLSQLTITDTAQGAKVVFEADSLTLNGVTKAQLEASDSFVFSRLLVGTEGNDRLFGTASTVLLDGLGGNDILGVDSPNTEIRGGDGFDMVYVGPGMAAFGLNIALAETSVEYVQGGAGDDVLDASGTADFDIQLYGGGGDDTLIAGSAGSFTMQGGQGTDTVVFGGNRADYSITVDADAWTGWTLVTRTETGDQYWTHTVERLQFADQTIDAPRPELQQTGTAGSDLIGGAGTNLVSYGLAGNDILTGSSSDDILVGGSGADQLIGGEGGDSLFVDNQDTQVDGGEGYDTVYLDDSNYAEGIRFTVAGTDVEFVYGGMGNDVIDASGVTGRVVLGEDAMGNGGDDVYLAGAYGGGFDGGDGTDTMVFAGNRADYDLSTYTDNYTWPEDGVMIATIRATGVQIWFSDVETLRFADATVAAGDVFGMTFGSEGADAITGDDRAETIIGLGGNDMIDGGAGNDWLVGGSGNDELIGKEGADTLDGGADVDTANYTDSATGVTVNLATGTGLGGDAEGDTFISIEHAVGSAFDDTFQGGNVRGQFLAGDGNDTMIGGSWYDWFEGGEGDDIMTGTGGYAVMLGGGGNDTMTGSLTNNSAMEGGLGNDTMTGGDWNDTMSDVEGGDDVIHGGGGDDVIVDRSGSNELYGDDGKDTIHSSTTQGSLLDGGGGDDFLYAYFGGNTLLGGTGNDILQNGEGGAMNFFTGGADADTFVYSAGVSVEAKVTVTDFEDGVDHIDIRLQPFEELTITDTAVGAVIEYHGTSPMLLAGVSASQITHEDFLMIG